MSQSPPNTFYGNHDTNVFTDLPTDYRNTLPKELKSHATSSPTLSVKSLTLKPSSPRLGKVKFGSSPSNMYRMNEVKENHMPVGRIQYLVAVHRKSCRSDAYFLSSQRSKPVLFGVPLLVRVRDGMSGRDVYAHVWAQVARLLSARPPARDLPNHATDCDDSLGYEFPFTLRLVSEGGAWCGVCAWPALCRGCALPTDDTPLLYGCTGRRARPRKQTNPPAESDVPNANSPQARAKLHRQASARLAADAQGAAGAAGALSRLDVGFVRATRRGRVMLAIDWDPTALHLRYQSTREKESVEHGSLAACSAARARPVDLASCLRAFTGEERLEQRYHCARCRSKQPATKKLQLWRAPPVLIIHLKRFQYVNNKWIKSQKVVNFPFQDFDPTPYLASVPQETILRHMEINNIFKRRSSVFVDEPISESESEDDGNVTRAVPKPRPKIDRKRKASVEVNSRQRLESTSLVTTPVTDDNLVDYHQHHLLKDQDPFDLKYKLYAVVSHSGQLSGGHYVAYARNPSGAWLCYNDSSCRELPVPDRPVGSVDSPDSPDTPDPAIDPAAAYLLFYQRQGLHYDAYLPDVSHRDPPPGPDLPDPNDADLRNMCVIA